MALRESIGASRAEEIKGNADGLRVVIEPIPGVSDEKVLTRAGFYFQCPPMEEFSYEVSHSHTDYDTVSAGQFSRRGGPQLRTVSFDTLFVDFGTYTVMREHIDFEEAVDELEQVCLSGSPFLLTAAHRLPPLGYETWSLTVLGPELQMAATLRTLKVSEKAGEPDARYVSVTFSEYRSPVVSRRGRGRKGARPGSRKFPRTVKLRIDGVAIDEIGNRIGRPPLEPVTLTRLARHFYGDGMKWRIIARANDLKGWGADYPLIFHPKFRKQGGTIKLPRPG